MASEENKFLKAFNDKLKDDKVPEKKKRVSSQVRSTVISLNFASILEIHPLPVFIFFCPQVRSMLIKSKATGRNELHEHDRYYLEISLPPKDSSGSSENILIYRYFSRLWTVGRALDEIVQEQMHMLIEVRPGHQRQLWNLRTDKLLPLNGRLYEFSPEELVLCDSVMIKTLPAQVALEKHTLPAKGCEGAASEEEAIKSVPEIVESHSDEVGPPSLREPQDPKAVSIIVTHGKNIHVISFSEEEWASGTVLDLKRKLTTLTQVQHNKQKLLYKGLLPDTTRLADGKLKKDCKVIMMG